MKNKKVKTPRLSGVAGVPLVFQLEALECGAACLTMILGYYNKWIPLEQIRMDCGVSRDGSSALNVVKAARRYGLQAQGYRMEPEELKENGTYPCIIHWNFNHFVVLNGFRGNRAYLNDPAGGAYSVTMEQFDKAFTGICLEFEPGEDFVPSGTPKGILSFLKGRLRDLRMPILFTSLTMTIAALLNLIQPAMNRVFYDRLLTGENPQWFAPFLGILGGLYLLQMILAALTAVTNLRLYGKIQMMGTLSYMWKILHLPMHFFSQRMVGDVASRQNGNAVIANTLVNVLAPLFLNSVLMVFYLAVMLRYSWVLTLVGAASSLLNMVISQWLARKRYNALRMQSRNSEKLMSATVAGVQLVETIKSSGAEDGFFQKWSGNYASVNAVADEKETAFLTWIVSAVSSLAGSIILGMGMYMVLQGSFTIGAITAFQGFFTSFMTPVNSFISMGRTIQEMRTQMERIDDVMQYPDDPNLKAQSEDGCGGDRKLSGQVSIRNVTFGYAPLSQPQISDISLEIPAGSCVALVGESGCGKSTVAKLISGLYTPWSGQILFDGKSISEIDRQVFSGSLAVVDQDVVLFEDTIAENIKMWDSSIEDFEMILAARDAQIHQDIMARPEGYEYRLTEGGKDFSGGQRQRMEIARVLAQEPTIIILDEATSALDAQTEFEVVKAIRERGITCIIIAHRLSTIRDCDRIVVLKQGKIAEQGTHETLLRQGGCYVALITNE